jgi:hypothetical protein
MFLSDFNFWKFIKILEIGDRGLHNVVALCLGTIFAIGSYFFLDSNTLAYRRHETQHNETQYNKQKMGHPA